MKYNIKNEINGTRTIELMHNMAFKLAFEASGGASDTK
jgi:hypothetical protein